MSTIKVKLSTWNRNTTNNKNSKYQRGIAVREGMLEIHPDTKKLYIKNGSKKWKPWDITISRKKDNSYINSKKEFYAGLCFQTKKEAEAFITKNKDTLDKLAKENPLFDHWSIMRVIKRFEPQSKLIYGKDII